MDRSSLVLVLVIRLLTISRSCVSTISLGHHVMAEGAKGQEMKAC